MPRSFIKASIITLCTLFSTTAFSVIAPLSSEPVHKQTLLDISEALKIGHFNRIELNDSLSDAILEQYLKDLDPARSYFYQEDIDSFEAYRHQFDDQIKAGDLDMAYQIYNRYQQRVDERLTYSIALLENKPQFDFNKDEALETDREDAVWIDSPTAMDNLWRKRIKSALLNLTLADKEYDKSIELLLKRYKNQLNRAAQVNSEDVFQIFTNAYTKQFDPHTQYFSPRRSENFRINMSLSLEGIGAVLQNESEFTQIVRLVPAGPAEKTGQLKASDRIIGVGQGKDGEIEDIIGWRLDDVVQLIRGPKDTVVRLEVKSSDREDAPSRIVSIVRNKVKLEEQSAQKRVIEIEHLNRTFRLGVIEIPAFYIDFAALQRGDADYKSTSRDVLKLLKELQQEEVDALIVDLRNNGGGSLREANETVGLFIKHGPTVQVKDSSGRVEIYHDKDARIAYSGPMAVMVNRLSASASEIFAGAIQDYNRGIVIGGQTFGKGTVQTLLPLDHGQLKLTHAMFYRISGDSTQNRGVLPDVSLPTLYNPEIIGESALDKALAWDQVKQTRHRIYPSIEPLLETIDSRYQQRVASNPDFIFMREQVDHLDDIRDETSIIPLNIDALKAQRKEAEQWQIDAENRRRLLKQQPEIKTLSELEESREKDAQGRPINPEAEAMLAESGRILIDAILLQLQYSAAQANQP